MEPRRIAHFDVLGRLGAGGMGVVYRARDRILGREVALKLVRPEQAGDALARQRFLREARAAAVLAHPGIATVYEAGEAPVDDAPEASLLFIAEELVPGEALSKRVRRGPPPAAEVLDLGLQLAEALGEAHGHGIVHRDVKPSNLMVTPEGRLKVLDFGLARRHAEADHPAADVDGDTWSRTAPGLVVGTPAYMAPEQIAGEAVGPAADVYSAGCVLYELLTGRPPHVGGSSAEVLRRTLTESPQAVTSLRPDAPLPLADAVMRALARDPAQRFASGRALAEALRETGSRPAAPCPAQPRSGPRAVRLRAVGRAAAAVAVASALAAGAWHLLGRGARPALAFHERDFVLVADVVNGTQEPAFDPALKNALETDLRQSRYVNVFDAAQVQNTLRMMRLPPETRIDERVGRDVCQRAGVRALVVPRVLKVGEAYQVGAALVEPSTGRVVEEVRASAPGREQVLLRSIDEVTGTLRERLGESLDSIARNDPPFTQYTTSSLEALNLVAVATRAMARAEFEKAERALREALQHDPEFAAARGSLGLLLIQFLGREEEGKKELARALADADEVSRREYLNIRALNRQFVAGDLPGALEDLGFIAELYPDMMQPYNNSGRILEALGRLEEAAAMYDRAHEKDPNAVVPLYNAFFLMGRLRDPQRTERVARALVALQPDYGNAAHTLAWSLAMQRRFPEAEEAMRATLKLDPENPWALPNLAHLLLRRGAVTEALAVYRRLGRVGPDARKFMDTDHDALCFGLALRAAGEEAEAGSVMQAAAEAMRARLAGRSMGAGDRGLLAALLAGAGRPAEARALVARAERDGEVRGEDAAWLARAHAVLGEPDRALALYERAVETGLRDPYYVLIDPSLASIRDRPEIDRLDPARAAAS
jgi:tetratricopeptide (TPR) repeat protein/tRNA A-37 threonylcarbamoyl transferase component Bud32